MLARDGRSAENLGARGVSAAAEEASPFQIGWAPRSEPWPAPASGGGAGLLLCGADGDSLRGLTDALARAGHACAHVRAGRSFGRDGAARTVRPGERDDLEHLFAEAGGAGAEPSVVIFAWSPADVACGGSDVGGARATAAWLRVALDVISVAGRRAPGARIWFVTRGAKAPRRKDARNAALGTLWGAIRSAARERPELWLGLLELSPTGGTPDWEQTVAILLGPHRETEVGVGGPESFVPRIVPLSETLTPPLSIAAGSGACLIAGGTGALGLAVARRLVDVGARHLVLVSRSAAPRDAAALEELRAADVTVETVACDVANRDDLGRLFGDLDARGVRLAGVVHAAGVGGMCALDDLTADAIEAPLRAKLDGARHLDALTRERALGFFVLFSSVSATWGAVGLAHHAAADQALDGIAVERWAHGLPAVSICWGPWAGSGMGAAKEDARGGLRRLGRRAALDAFVALATFPAPVVGAACVDWPALARGLATHVRRPLFELMPAASAPAAQGEEGEL